MMVMKSGRMGQKIKTNNDIEEETDTNAIAQALAEDEADRVEWIKTGKPRLEKLKKTHIWSIIDAVLDELVAKKAIIETTARDCIVSYLIEALSKHDFLSESITHADKKVVVRQLKKCSEVSLVGHLQMLISQSIKDLIDNRDLKEKINHSTIVLFIEQSLLQNNLIKQK